MVETDPVRVALRYVNEINRHDPSALAALMTPEFRFVDSLGRELRGAERMREAWVAYFALFPDYRIIIHQHLSSGELVALFGGASGTLEERGKLPNRNHWTLPAAWQAVVQEDRVAEWQVYSDNTPVQRLLDGRG
jgi:ketosteroid isomerase-like protein